MRKKRTQVVIVGGGPVGMALAIDLAQRGISSTVVERRTEPHRIPKGQGLTQRSMEHFYSWGVADQVRAARLLPRGFTMSGVTAYRDLMSQYWAAPRVRELVNAYYFQSNERLPQYLTEQVLRDRMSDFSDIDVRTGWSAAQVEQDDQSVRIGIIEQGGSGREVLEGNYVVGCDGSHSTVREQVGIARGGEDFDQLMILAVFRSRELHEGLQRFPPRTTFRAMHPDLKGFWQFFGRIDVGEGFFFHAPVPADTTRDNYDFHGLLQRAAGFEFACEFDYVGFWDMRIAVAEKYQVGRVFIAGDAAHSHPPYGGYGLNSGLDDVANLGWKIAARLKGWATDSLLETYSEERQPIFHSTAQDFIASRIEADRRFLERHSPERDGPEFERLWHENVLEAEPRTTAYAPHYEGSSLVFGPPGGVSSARGTHTFAARAGHHLPPQLLSSGQNVFEELGPDFTLLAFEAQVQDVSAFDEAARSLGVPLKVVRDSMRGGREAYEARLILVRPDRHVAWTGDGASGNAQEVIRNIFGGAQHH